VGVRLAMEPAEASGAPTSVTNSAFFIARLEDTRDPHAFALRPEYMEYRSVSEFVSLERRRPEVHGSTTGPSRARFE